MGTGQIIRFGSGDQGIDQILHGGLIKQGIHIVAGVPGTGKTILTQQIGYHAARQGHQVVTVTALAETHERLISHLERFDFFDPTLVGAKVYYLSASRIFIELGLLPSVNELRQLTSSPRAEILIFEGLSALASLASSPIEFRRFLYDLNAHLMLIGCMGLFVTDQTPQEIMSSPEYALGDTVILLHNTSWGSRRVRELEVVKSRGSETLLGRHSFEIGNQGVIAYPRIETVEGQRMPVLVEETPRKFGIPSLDEILGGGLAAGSTTALIGAPGSGKTLLGTYFVAEGARNDEPGLIWTFQDTPELLARHAASVGLDLDGLIAEGKIKVQWRPPVDLLIDREFQALLHAVEAGGIRRLLIDQFFLIEDMARESGRSLNLLITLSNSLRARGVTTIVNTLAHKIDGLALDIDQHSALRAAHNMILLTYQNPEGRRTRTLAVLKKSPGTHDTSLRDFTVTSSGISFADA